MDPVLYVLSVAGPLAFAAGVVFHKYVISEADSIKSHVSAAENRIRGDVDALLEKVKAKL